MGVFLSINSSWRLGVIVHLADIYLHSCCVFLMIPLLYNVLFNINKSKTYTTTCLVWLTVCLGSVLD